MPKILGLGHFGFYCRDLEKMVAFYRDVLGMTITKQNWQFGIIFFSSEPQSADHEIALVRGRPEGPDPHLINQISLRTGTLAELREFHQRIVAAGCEIDEIVTHGSAIGCYFFDPEGNRTEVFWLTGRPCWVPASVPIDIYQPDDVVMAEVDRVWEPLRHVPPGGVYERAEATLNTAGAATPA